MFSCPPCCFLFFQLDRFFLVPNGLGTRIAFRVRENSAALKSTGLQMNDSHNNETLSITVQDGIVIQVRCRSRTDISFGRSWPNTTFNGDTTVSSLTPLVHSVSILRTLLSRLPERTLHSTQHLYSVPHLCYHMELKQYTLFVIV